MMDPFESPRGRESVVVHGGPPPEQRGGGGLTWRANSWRCVVLAIANFFDGSVRMLVYCKLILLIFLLKGECICCR